MFPYGLNIMPSTDAYWIYPLNLALSVWIIYTIIIYTKRKYFFRIILYITTLAFNLLVLFTHTFYVVLPILDQILSIFWYVLIGAVLLEWNYTNRMGGKKKEKSKL